MALIPILILAAGSSTRMGDVDKLLQDVGGQSLIEQRVTAALACRQPVLVTLPARDIAPDRWRAIDHLPVTNVPVPEAQNGLSASLSSGVRALPAAADGVLILLADMPDVSAADILTVLQGFDGQTIRRGATVSGQPGHPVLFPSSFFNQLRDQTGDNGARNILKTTTDVELIDLPGQNALSDLDTPQDWARWRDTRGQG